MLDVNFLQGLTGSLDVEADIHCHITPGPGSVTTIKVQGNQPSLFSATCEIVKAMALKEPEGKGWRRKYVELVCDLVLMELEEEET